MFRFVWVGILLGLMTSGCMKPELTARLYVLEQNVQTLQNQVDRLTESVRSQALKKPSLPPEQLEQSAEGLYREILAALNRLDAQTAKTLYAQLENDYSSTKVWTRAKRLGPELAVIGKPAGKLSATKWLQGNAKMDDGSVTLLVFWEKWCPHCRREMPVLEQVYVKYKDRGLNLVGITKGSRGIPDDQIKAFIKEQKVTYPNGKDGLGELSARFGVRGVPAAVMIRDGEVVWRGHPARLTESMYDALLP